MIQLFAVLSLALILTNGLGGAKCGVRIRTKNKGPGYCYLNAGRAKGKNHGLNDKYEYNAMWQCNGISGKNKFGRIWYFEEGGYKDVAKGKRNSGIFTILENRNKRYEEFFLSRDGTRDQGSDVGKKEYNAKVDQKFKQQIWFLKDPKNKKKKKKNFNLVIQRKKGKWGDLVLERAATKRKYKLVTGAEVYGYEAKWEIDRPGNYRKNNYIELLPYPCDVGKAGKSDIDPIFDYPMSDNPGGSVMVEIPAGASQYVVALLGLLAVVLLICAFYNVYSACKGKSKKVVYKAVKFDSESEAV